MTHQDLNHLFAEARKAPAETSVEEVTAWVGAAALTTSGVLGIAAKLKLLIAKKSILMLGSILGAAGITVVSVALISSSQDPDKTPVNSAVDPSEKQEIEHVAIVQEPEKNAVADLGGTIDKIPAMNEAMAAPSAEVISQVFETIWFEIKPTRIFTAPAPAHPTHYAEVSCITKNKKSDRTPVKGSGNLMTETREIGPFSKLTISGTINVFLIQGEKESVRVEADENLLEFIKTELKGDELFLSSARAKESKKMAVYITVKDLKSLNTCGIGDVQSQNALKGTALSIENSAVGDLNLQLDYQSIEMNYNGVGDVLLKGKANEVEIDCSGVGDIHAYELITQTMDLNHSGVGHSNVYANESIKVKFTGVGDVNYKGDPKQKNIEKNGVGSVSAH